MAEESTDSLLDPDVLQRVLRRLEATDIDELEVTWGESRLWLRRQPGRGAPPAYIDQSPGRADTAPGVAVPAPLTGVYYSRPSPEQAAFVTVGDPVEAGQVVALIETMKLFNEVMTEVAGTVLSIAPRDGDLVEAGQPLVYVQPQQEDES